MNQCTQKVTLREVKHSVNLVWPFQTKGAGGGEGGKKEKKKDKEKTFTVKHNAGVDLLLLPRIPEPYKEHGVKTPLLSLGVYNIGLVHKFKANILTHLLFFRDHTYKAYIKSDPKLLRSLIQSKSR